MPVNPGQPDAVDLIADLRRRVRNMEVGAHNFGGESGGAGVVWRGQWTTTNSYAVNDLVYSQGSTWRALVAVETGGTQPVEGSTWALVAQRGAQGATGPQGPAGTGGGGGTDTADLETQLNSILQVVGPDYFPMADGTTLPLNENGFEISYPQVSMDPFGFAFLQGMIVPNGGNVGTLPELFRPAAPQMFRVAMNTDEATTLSISTDGIITTSAGNDNEISLDGCSYLSGAGMSGGVARADFPFPPANMDAVGPTYMLRHRRGYVQGNSVPTTELTGEWEITFTAGETPDHDPVAILPFVDIPDAQFLPNGIHIAVLDPWATSNELMVVTPGIVYYTILDGHDRTGADVSGQTGTFQLQSSLEQGSWHSEIDAGVDPIWQTVTLNLRTTIGLSPVSAYPDGFFG